MSVQVDKTHYTHGKYATLARFISYFHQIDLIKKYRPESLLFVGVGDGLVPHYLQHNLAYPVATCDFDPTLKPDLVADVRALPCQPGEFDAIALFEVLEHIPFEDLPPVLCSLHSIAKRYVFISVPFRHTAFEFILRFPLIRSLLKRDFLRLALRIPLSFGGFAQSGQHYWEIDRGLYRIERWRELLREGFRIVEEERPLLNSGHWFFVLEKTG